MFQETVEMSSADAIEDQKKSKSEKKVRYFVLQFTVFILFENI